MSSKSTSRGAAAWIAKNTRPVKKSRTESDAEVEASDGDTAEKVVEDFAMVDGGGNVAVKAVAVSTLTNNKSAADSDEERGSESEAEAAKASDAESSPVESSPGPVAKAKSQMSTIAVTAKSAPAPLAGKYKTMPPSLPNPASAKLQGARPPKKTRKSADTDEEETETDGAKTARGVKQAAEESITFTRFDGSDSDQDAEEMEAATAARESIPETSNTIAAKSKQSETKITESSGSEADKKEPLIKSDDEDDESVRDDEHSRAPTKFAVKAASKTKPASSMQLKRIVSGSTAPQSSKSKATGAKPAKDLGPTELPKRSVLAEAHVSATQAGNFSGCRRSGRSQRVNYNEEVAFKHLNESIKDELVAHESEPSDEDAVLDDDNGDDEVFNLVTESENESGASENADDENEASGEDMKRKSNKRKAPIDGSKTKSGAKKAKADPNIKKQRATVKSNAGSGVTAKKGSSFTTPLAGSRASKPTVLAGGSKSNRDSSLTKCTASASIRAIAGSVVKTAGTSTSLLAAGNSRGNLLGKKA